MNEEIWKTIPGYEGHYEVSDLGRIRSVDRYVRTKGNGKKLCKSQVHKTDVHQTGYEKVNLSVGGRQKNLLVHCLVMLAFVGPKPDARQVRHLDGNRLNNALANLAYGTALENAADKIVHERNNEGEQNPRSKLKLYQVLEIVDRVKGGERQCDIADEFKVSRSIINHIILGNSWKRSLAQSESSVAGALCVP